jgi:hypothetical protein
MKMQQCIGKKTLLLEIDDSEIVLANKTDFSVHALRGKVSGFNKENGLSALPYSSAYHMGNERRGDPF